MVIDTTSHHLDFHKHEGECEALLESCVELNVACSEHAKQSVLNLLHQQCDSDACGWHTEEKRSGKHKDKAEEHKQKGDSARGT